MSLRSDIAGDWEFVEGVESVTLTPQNPAATAISAVRGLLDLRGGNPLIAATLGIDPSDATWHLWAETITGSYEPQNGDLITGSGSVVWVITSVGESLMAGRFICSARQQV